MAQVINIRFKIALVKKEKIVKNLERQEAIDYPGGRVEYSVIERPSKANPILIVPGFSLGRFALDDFAQTLSEKGDRTVIYPDQPKPNFSRDPLSAVDHHAEANLAIVEAEGLTESCLDTIGHSFGAIILAKMAILAKERGYSCFDFSNGSRTIFIAPAGSNQHENFMSLGIRFANFFTDSLRRAKELDPGSKKMKASAKNLTSSPIKTTREIAALSNETIPYEELEGAGVKPFILGYGDDKLFPHRVVEATLTENSHTLSGYAMPADGSESSHNDLLYFPNRTVDSILQIFDK